MKLVKSKQYGDYEKIVTFPVWSNYKVHIVFSEDIAGSLRKRYGKKADPRAGEAGAMHRYDSDGHSHIFFKVGDAGTGTIAHECYHAVRAMMMSFADCDTMENETTAYHLGYLVSQATEFKNALIDAQIGGECSCKKFGVKSSNTGGANGLTSSGGSKDGVSSVREAS